MNRASILVTLFAVACGGAAVDTQPVDNDTDVADTDEPGPCPPFAPEPCVAFDGVICTIDDPEKAPVSWGTLWPEDARDSTLCSGVDDCGHFSMLPCGEGRWFARMFVDGWEMYDVSPTDDGLDVTRTTLLIYDPGSRENIAQGALNMGSSSCPVRWYGEPEAAVCFYEWLEIYRATANACIASDDAICDPDQCRLDLVTGHRYDECAEYHQP